MTLRPEPLRIFVAMLRAASSRDAANAAIGDIFDELNELKTAGSGPAWPALWLNSRVVGAIVFSSLAAIPCLTRVGALILRDAFRGVRRSPAHSLFITAVLALAMAAGTVTFSVVDAVVLRPLPFPNVDRLVSIPSFDQAARKWRITPDVFWRIHDQNTTLEMVSPQQTTSGSSITVGDVTDYVPVSSVRAETFALLGLHAGLGRLWTAEDEARGDSDVAVVGYRFWRDRLRGSADVIGMPVMFGRRSARVIGVLSPASDRPGVQSLQADVWLPWIISRSGTDGGISPTALMKPGVTPADVAADVQRIAAADGWRPDVRRFGDTTGSALNGWMLLALGASGLVVLIACVNAANLMLTRSVQRLRETGVRASLGASRTRVAASAVAEGLILAGGGAAAAVLFAFWGVSIAKNALMSLPLGVSSAAAIAINGRVFGAAIAAALVTGLLVAVVPAWQSSRASLISLLKESAPVVTGGRGLWRSTFLVTEVAAVSVLFVVSWLFVASLVHSMRVDVGVDRGHLIGINPRMPFRGAVVDDVKARVERLPGVTGVAVSRGASPPIFGRASGAWITNKMTADGSGAPPIEVLDHRVTRNFFDVLGMRLLRGTTWPVGAEDEPFDAAPVVLDERVASQLFGAADPIGRQVATSAPAGVHTVVGLVPHVQGRGPEEDSTIAAYFPLKRDASRVFASLVARTAGPPDPLVSSIADALASVAPAQPEPYVYSADDVIWRITMTRRFTAFLMSLFGLVGALIGAAGIYAVMAAVVAQKTREIGVRVALGATSRNIQRQILGLALRHLVAGLVIGLPCAWWLSRGFTALLFRVTPADVSVYLGVAILLCVVGLAAALIPSRRAARVDPIICLRAQ